MDRLKSDGRARTQSMIEKGAEEFVNKFAQIEQLFKKLESEELGARDKLRRVLQDLTEEVNLAEQKHKKIQEFLKTFKDN